MVHPKFCFWSENLFLLAAILFWSFGWGYLLTEHAICLQYKDNGKNQQPYLKWTRSVQMFCQLVSRAFFLSCCRKKSNRFMKSGTKQFVRPVSTSIAVFSGKALTHSIEDIQPLSLSQIKSHSYHEFYEDLFIKQLRFFLNELIVPWDMKNVTFSWRKW